MLHIKDSHGIIIIGITTALLLTYVTLLDTIVEYEIIPIYPIKSNYTYYIDYTNYKDSTMINSTDIHDAFNEWSELNDNINFKYIDNRRADIIVQFETYNPNYNAGLALCVIEKCTIIIYQGAHDCNDEYQPLSRDMLHGTIRHEIGHTLGIRHNDIKGHLMYSTIDPKYDYNPRNLTIPDRMPFAAMFKVEYQIYLDVIKRLDDGEDILKAQSSHQHTIDCLKDYKDKHEINNNPIDILKHNIDVILTRL